MKNVTNKTSDDDNSNILDIMNIDDIDKNNDQHIYYDEHIMIKRKDDNGKDDDNDEKRVFSKVIIIDHNHRTNKSENKKINIDITNNLDIEEFE